MVTKPGRGGARAGAGRPKTEKAIVVLSVRIPRGEIKEIDRLAIRSNMSRQEWVLREIRRAFQKTRPR